MDGKYVAIGDQGVHSTYTNAIYQTMGAGGKVVHETPLGVVGDVIGS